MGETSQMHVNNIILHIVDDQNTEGSAKEILADFNVKTAQNLDEALNSIKAEVPSMILINQELKNLSGLELFRKIHSFYPEIRCIMASSSNNIPLAVSATKLGISDFISRPFEAQKLLLSVNKLLAQKEIPSFIFPEAFWLKGQSTETKNFYAGIQGLAASAKNIFLFGETGINKKEAVLLIHNNSFQRSKKVKTIDFSHFPHENMESYFWSALTEVMAEPEAGSTVNKDERFGTVFYENIDSLDDNFKSSLFSFLSERREKIDKSIISVIGIKDKAKTDISAQKHFQGIEIPPLRDRREDIPFLVIQYLKLFAVKYGKSVSALSNEAWDFLMLYDYPGNYDELSSLIEQAMLHSNSAILGLNDLPIDNKMISEVSRSRASMENGADENKLIKEKMLYSVLMAKTDNNTTRVADFLDTPETILTQRMDEIN